MSNFRLNARKPKGNAGLPTPKGELYLLYTQDIISLPPVAEKGILCNGDIHLKNGRRFHILYLTPSTQKRNIKSDGEVDSRGFKKKVTGNFPGDDIEIHQFIKNNINQGFVIVMNSYDKGFHRIYGSVENPLYFTGDFNDDDSAKGYELTFEQNFADENPLLFYNGTIVLDESAIDDPDIEFDGLFARRDGSNLSDLEIDSWAYLFDNKFLPLIFFPINNQW